ncbi:MAG: hypothetical protein CM15mP18_3850 [Methanobacteriota archaeon]|nr:MAG: hypothetical protein CM15mP18_3850 [Euryarchaeota archaeon]
MTTCSGFWNTEGLVFCIWRPRIVVKMVHRDSRSHNGAFLDEHAYHVMHKLAYLDRCKTVAATHNVAFAAEADRTDADLVFDSRHHAPAQTRCCNISMDWKWKLTDPRSTTARRS